MDRLIGAAPLPRGTRVAPVLAGGVPAEWIVPPGVETDAVLLYLHGGGYTAGSFATHRLVTEQVAQAAGVRALLPAYLPPGAGAPLPCGGPRRTGRLPLAP